MGNIKSRPTETRTVCKQDESSNERVDEVDMKSRAFQTFVKEHNRELVDCGLLYTAMFLRESLLELLKREQLTSEKKNMIEKALSYHLPEIVKIIEAQDMNYKSKDEFFQSALADKDAIMKELRQTN